MGPVKRVVSEYETANGAASAGNSRFAALLVRVYSKLPNQKALFLTRGPPRCHRTHCCRRPGYFPSLLQEVVGGVQAVVLKVFEDAAGQRLLPLFVTALTTTPDDPPYSALY